MQDTPLYHENDRGEEEGLIPLFLANREGDNRSPATISFYRDRLLYFRAWQLRNGYRGVLEEFTLETVNAYVRQLQAKDVKYDRNPYTKPRPGKLSSVYVRNSVRTLKTLAVWLAEYDYTNDDVLAKRRVPKIEKKEIRNLQRWEIEKLLSVIDRRYYLGVRDLAVYATNYLRQHPGDFFRLQMNLGHETLDILRVYAHLAHLEDSKERPEPSVMDRLEIRVRDVKRSPVRP